MDPPGASIPVLHDLTVDNITENIIRANSQGSNPRLIYVLDRLVNHLHDFTRETRLSTEEWRAGLAFLTEVGQKCTDVRQEFVTLSDTFGLSMLVNSIDHPKSSQATEGSVLGPFHSHEAKEMAHGEIISHDPCGEPCLILGTVKDTKGNPIEGVRVDIWESDSTGHYDVQYPDRNGPDGRCIMKSDHDGRFWCKATKPIPYPIPQNGPVGRLLGILQRHPYRPAHIHFMFEKPGFDQLVTSLYFRKDPYNASDVVFGVKDTLIVDLNPADEATAAKYDVSIGSAFLKYDFFIMSNEEVSSLKEQNSRDALKRLGQKMKLWNGLPVPDVD